MFYCHYDQVACHTAVMCLVVQWLKALAAIAALSAGPGFEFHL